MTDRHPALVEPWHLFGVVQLQRSKSGAAEQELRLAVERQPDHVDAHYNLGLVLIARLKIDAALAALCTPAVADHGDAGALREGLGL